MIWGDKDGLMLAFPKLVCRGVYALILHIKKAERKNMSE